MWRSLVAGVALALVPGAALALDPEVNRPYRVQIVLRVAHHRLLTDLFKEQVRRELHDGAQAALGNMGDVEVVTRHRLLPEVEAKGLQEALDNWKEVSDTKTHFVLIDYVDGRYQIQTRQHDGSTGLSSPVVRRAATTDREFVARQAGLMMDQDFGPVGTVEEGSEGGEVRVTLKGSGLGTPLDRWLRPGDVFAIAHLVQGRGGEQSFRVPWALLQLVDEPKGGVCRCRLFHRLKGPLNPTPRTVGFRCLKLGTTDAPLRLRLVDAKSGAPVANMRVTVSPDGFQGTPRDDLQTDHYGLAETNPKTPYHNIAFAKVLNVGNLVANIPLEIFADHTILCPIGVDANAEQAADLGLRRERLRAELLDALNVTDQYFKDLSDLVEKQAHQEAVKVAEADARELEEDVRTRDIELKNLRKDAEGTALDFDELETRLKALKSRGAKLQEFIGRLKTVVKKETDPNRGKWEAKVEEADLLVEQADYDKAIQVYESVLKEIEPGKAKTELEQKVAGLKEAWRIRDQNTQGPHRHARIFVYEIWPTLDTVKEIHDNLDKAVQAFETCKQVGDRLTPRKMRQAAGPQLAILQKRTEALMSQDTEDARNEKKMIGEVSARLKELYERIENYLKPTGK